MEGANREEMAYGRLFLQGRPLLSPRCPRAGAFASLTTSNGLATKTRLTAREVLRVLTPKSCYPSRKRLFFSQPSFSLLSKNKCVRFAHHFQSRKLSGYGGFRCSAFSHRNPVTPRGKASPFPRTSFCRFLGIPRIFKKRKKQKERTTRRGFASNFK